MRTFIAACLAACVIGSPVEERALLAPSVTIKNGTVVGASLLGIDTFNGIPFAQPPVGQLRLRPPQSINKSFGTLSAVAPPNGCPQFITQLDTSSLSGAALAAIVNNPALQAATAQSEDCLFLNVQRPSGLTAKSKLPVVVWIYGGGFEFGSTAAYNAQRIIAKSVQLGKPVVYVAMNYRLAGFGFLPGAPLAKEGSTNLGLRDQRLALQWVQENIAAFGGDPDQVTIWGESAGSLSVFDHLIINNGDHTYNGKPLFRAGIMNSGSVLPTRNVTSDKAQITYNAVVKAAKCDTSPDPVGCLRSLPYADFNAATNSVPGIFGYQSVNLAYLPRPDPSSAFFPRSGEEAIAQGKYAKVPVIVGDQEDEGTLFAISQGNITNTAQLKDYIASYFINTSRSITDALVDVYPDNPAAGSPFRTGAANNIYPEFKRLAAILGDIVFTLTRRAYLANTTEEVPAYSYLNTYGHVLPVLGTGHALDVTTNYYGAPGVAAHDPTLTYYISFFYYADPNRIKTANTTLQWPRWTNEARKLVNFGVAGTSLLDDDFRTPQYNQIVASIGLLQG